MKTQIGITEANREKVVTILCKILADENVLYLKTKNAHWNVEGSDFHEKHLFFETQFTQLDELIDSVAERIRSLGLFALATMKAFLSLTQLTEKNKNQNDSASFMKELLIDHESIIINLRGHIEQVASNYHDLGTSDFMTGLMEKHEKAAWFLRSHLK